MKTVYINESMLHNEDFKKRVLMDALPDDIVNKIISHRTSLGNNPSIPDVYDTPFLLKMAEKGFNDAKNVLKEIGSIDDVAENDLRSALSTLLVRCKEIEKPHRAKLEKICVNYVIDLFGVPDETVDIEVSLVDNVTFDKKTINLDPIDGNDEIEYNSVDDVLSLKGEIYKRRLLNVLCIGAAMRLSSNIESYANVIEEIDPTLLDLYHKILAINYYLLFEKEDIGMTDENKMQMGVVEVSLGTEKDKVKIDAQSVIFPVLLCELVRGFMELFISHGLPKDRNKAMSVLGKADFLKAEPWDMKFGPILWDLFSDTFNDINYEELPYLLKRVSSLEVDKFNFLMKEVFAKTKTGKRIMSKYSFKAKDDIEYDKFLDKMHKLKTDKEIITDDFIHP